MGSSNTGTLIHLWRQCPQWTWSVTSIGKVAWVMRMQLTQDSPPPLPPSSSGCFQVTGQPHTSNPPSASSVTVDQWLNLLMGILSFGNKDTSQSHVCSVNSPWTPSPCPQPAPDWLPAGEKGCSTWSGSCLETAPLPSHLRAWSKSKNQFYSSHL